MTLNDVAYNSLTQSQQRRQACDLFAIAGLLVNRVLRTCGMYTSVFLRVLRKQ